MIDKSSVPKFAITNVSSSPVAVKVMWQKETKDLGILAPRGNVVFEINATSSARFEVTKPNGDSIMTNPMPFNYGTTIDVEINNAGVDVVSNT